MKTPKLEVSAEEYRKMVDRSMTEREWRKNVKELAAHHGWEVLLEIPDRAYHALIEAGKHDKSISPVLQALRGFPDLWIGNRTLRQTLFVELKKEGGRISSIWQEEKAKQLWDCGVSGGYYLPSDRDELQRTLMGE